MSKPTIYNHLVPVGSIILWGGANMPSGWLLCNGATLSRADYPELADALDVDVHADEFDLPDYRDRVPQGAGTVSPNVAIEAGIPELHGLARTNNWLLMGGSSGWRMTTDGGLFTDWSSEIGAWGSISSSNTSGDYSGGFYFTASNYSSIYGNSSSVQPPTLCNHFLIKT